MAKRTKQIVWHKKQQRFISPTLLRPHHGVMENEDEPSAAITNVERKKFFVKDLLRKIHRAVKKGNSS